jgi:hypothetical protein
MSLDNIVSVSITTLTSSPTRAGFGQPLLMAYIPTTVLPNRVREYSSLTGMLEDGFLVTDAAYLMAQALKAQSTSVPSWKVGRKALPSQQSVDLTPTVTTAGEITQIEVEAQEKSYTVQSGDAVADVCDGLVAALNAIPGVLATDNTTHVTVTPAYYMTATVTVDVANNSEWYEITLGGTAYRITSDGTATVTEIRDALLAAIPASVATVVTNGADALDITAATHAGLGMSVDSETPASISIVLGTSANRLLSIGNASRGLTVKVQTPDPGVATDFANILLEDTDFYGVGLDSEGEAEIKALAAAVEAQTKIAGFSTIDTETGDSVVTDDVMSELASAGYDRTYIIKSEVSGEYAGIRWMGVMFPKDAGKATWAMKRLGGVTVSSPSASERATVLSKKGNVYVQEAGLSVTLFGKLASGEFIDLRRGVDWFKARLQERIFADLAKLDKLPYEDAADLFYAHISAQFSEAAGFVAPNTPEQPWVIVTPTASEVSVADKANRLYPGIEASAYLQGAVHTAQVKITLSL